MEFTIGSESTISVVRAFTNKSYNSSVIINYFEVALEECDEK